MKIKFVFHRRRSLRERLKNPVFWKILVSIAKFIYWLAKSIYEIRKLFQ